MVKQAPVKGRQAVKVNFVLAADAVAGSVSVVGDFNGWDPLALIRPGFRGGSIAWKAGWSHGTQQEHPPIAEALPA